jgi:hypothetical protein
VDVSPSEGGNVIVDGVTVLNYPMTYSFLQGEETTIEAKAASGYRFDRWSGSLTGSTSPTTVILDCNKDITAHFSPVMFTLTIQHSGRGSTTPSAGTHVYDEGAVVAINASPDSGWRFDRWTGDVADAGRANTTVMVDSDKTITAKFADDTAGRFNWPLFGGIVGGLVLVALLLVVARRISQ